VKYVGEPINDRLKTLRDFADISPFFAQAKPLSFRALKNSVSPVSLVSTVSFQPATLGDGSSKLEIPAGFGF
jgi:hypothetical protein